MNEFKDQLDAAEKDKVTALVAELRELASKGQSADPSVDAEQIKAKISETQQASLGLFQKASCLSNGSYPYLFISSRYTKSGAKNQVIVIVRNPQITRRRKKKKSNLALIE